MHFYAIQKCWELAKFVDNFGDVWIETVLSFWICFEKSPKIYWAVLYIKSLKNLKLKSGNRTFHKYYRNDYRNVYVFWYWY
jgi:hypothetical protein